ncbi:MAG: Gmad2 immunoglobulin-like domain-containing protein [Candidatus Paceibacteria bacterium]
MQKIIIVVFGLLLIGGGVWWLMAQDESVGSIAENDDEGVMCTMDALMCPDGSYVGRTGPDCQFVCPNLPEVPADIQAHIDSKADLITVVTPVPLGIAQSPLVITGEARGYWFFEASFPIVVTDWNGLIVGEGYATAGTDWMTEDFVPYTASVEFENPYNDGDPDFMKNGTLILQKDNPSGLPEHDDALELPIRFAP